MFFVFWGKGESDSLDCQWATMAALSFCFNESLLSPRDRTDGSSSAQATTSLDA
jgi:hypothetical protein